MTNLQSKLSQKTADLINQLAHLEQDLNKIYQEIPEVGEFEFHSFQIQLASEQLGAAISKLILFEAALKQHTP